MRKFKIAPDTCESNESLLEHFYCVQDILNTDTLHDVYRKSLDFLEEANISVLRLPGLIDILLKTL